ncbi:unnamed protein product [Lymnaea stagnalis]|uniref:Uncharacterized protein n=1 Tax=Lymnaea stagnalis TaxID=6523 RepID=A0AAV2H683_LYMST
MACSISAGFLETNDQMCYKFSHSRRGIAVIIVNNRTGNENIRQGSEKDTTFLQQIFNHYGFEIRTFCNMKSKELLSGLLRISREDHSENDCFAMAISTHGMESYGCGTNGTREDVIETQDELIPVRFLLKLFTDDKCPSLQGKPRLVFIQACRGQELDNGLTITCTSPKADLEAAGDALMDAVLLKERLNPGQDDTDAPPHSHDTDGPNSNRLYDAEESISASDTTDGKKSLSDIYIAPAPCYEHFLVMYATPPGYFAFRNKADGSWFIRILADVLLRSDGRQSLTRELTRVIRRVAHDMQSYNTNPRYDAKKQSPVIYSKLIKEIYLTPKNGELPRDSTS